MTKQGLFNTLSKYMEVVRTLSGKSYVGDLNVYSRLPSFTCDELKIMRAIEWEMERSDCNCKYEVLRSGDIVKIDECDYHKLVDV
jgi:hypothetical protein